MKVGIHAGQLLQPVPGGIGRYTVELMLRLPRLGVDTTAFGAGERPPAVPDAVHWTDLGWPRASWRYEVWHRLGRPTVDLDVDVVHAPSLAVPPTKRPLVVTVHDVAFLRVPDAATRRGVAFHKRGLRIAKASADIIISPTEFTRQELIQEGFDEGRIVISAPGVAVPPARPQFDLDAIVVNQGVTWPYVLHVGTIEPRKEIGLIIDAVQRARESMPELQLVLVGAPGWGPRPNLEADGVLYLGALGDRTTDALIRRATVAIVASKYEGFGLPVLESIARGTPTVISDAPSLVEVADDAAVTFPVGDVDACASAILRVVGDEALRAQLSARGPVRAARFTWDATAKGHAQAYALAAGS